MIRIKLESAFDPYKHLALEHYYLYQDQEIEVLPVLLIYRNSQSVVFGNFQNPWLECNVSYCLHNNINLVRRFSGGGCVYHDPGNINFCLIGAKEKESKNKLTDYLLSFFQHHHVPVIRGEKSDLLLLNQKISGSAFRETKNRTLHHCTLLFNSNLQVLNHALSSELKDKHISTKALPSRRTCVTDLSHSKWSSPEALIQDFTQFIGGHVVLQDDHHDMNLDIVRWNSWDQTWGRTPRFNLSHGDFEMEISSAVLTQIIFKNKYPKVLELKLPIALNLLLLQIELKQEHVDWLKKIGIAY